MTFSGLVIIVWIAVTVLVVALYTVPKAAKQRRLRKRYGDAAVTSKGVFRMSTLIPAVLLVAAGAFLALAFGQFRLNRQVTHGTVILALDVSDSMDATDVRPNRLTAAQDAARAFLGQLPADFKVGVVTFAGDPKVLVAPTGDRTEVSGALEGLSTSRGTVIGDGLSTALDTISAGGEGSSASAIVLLSDGQDSGSQVTPIDAAARAQAMGVPVFTVAITGAGAGASVSPGATASSAPEGSSLLGDLATTTGAQAFSASSAGQLTGIYRTLGSRLSYDLAVGGSGKLYLIVAAALLLAAGLAASLLSRRE